jgi:hypothetical protein
MSVVKMIVTDDQHYVSGEPHGSCAQWVYAACSRNPKSLEELDKLLPEFDADDDLCGLFGCDDGLKLEPVDAGLIIVDLAKKWIYAEDTYFGAHRRGRYRPRDDGRTIEYQFSSEWQFVAEVKWFRYLQTLGLKPYGNLNGPFYEKAEHKGLPVDDFEFEKASRPARSRDNEDYDDEFSVDVTHMNRICSLVDFEPQNTEEARDYQTLEHIARYDNDATAAQSRLEKAQKEIASLKIELQAVENLGKRTGEPRWELKRIAFQARIEQQEKRISRCTDEQAEAAAMAAELRAFLLTDKGREMLKMWEEEAKDDGEDMEIPF